MLISMNNNIAWRFAPMEGITSYRYRSLHAEMFPGVEQYYAPFIAPDGTGRFRVASVRDLLPENNPDLCLVPQILCNRAEAFLAVSRELAAMGYREVDLNAGCPSGTVVPKHKGAGMLADLRSLDDFLAEIFSRCPLRISVKTRLGLESTAEFPSILEIYNKYPLSELIIHARDRKGLYRSVPDLEVFAAAAADARSPICYNGNVFTGASLERLQALVPALDRVMLGRGAVCDPALFRRLRGGAPLSCEELREFLDRLLDRYLSTGLDAHHALGCMKEIWYYSSWMFPDSKALRKRLNKARSLEEYRDAAAALFRSGLFSPSASFPDPV